MINWAGRLKPNNVIPVNAGFWWQLRFWPRLLQPNRLVFTLIISVLTGLAALLLATVLSFFAIANSQLISALAVLLLFSLLRPGPERQANSAQSVYPHLFSAYRQLVRETSNLDSLLQFITASLVKELNIAQASFWLYHPQDGLLTLAYQSGEMIGPHLSELPLDVALNQLPGTLPVETLPESALRQGLLALQIDLIAALNLPGELVGLIGLGGYRQDGGSPRQLIPIIDMVAGQLALVVKNSRLINDLEETLTKLQLAYRRTIDTQAEERRNLAIELHDDILSRLTTMGMTLRNSQRQLTSDPAKVQCWLEMLEQETRYLNSRLREITQGLHPAILADLGLIAALQAYMDALTKHALPASAPRTIDLTAQGFDNARIPDPKLERDLYYITRQALDNALKHAQAEQILIHLRWRDEALTVTVQDNGIGFKTEPEDLMGQQGHLGLLSMHERVLAWRGRLSFQSTPGRGTTVYVRFPISQPSPNPTHLQAFTHYLRSRE
jgi:signal transduction histidine kinase